MKTAQTVIAFSVIVCLLLATAALAQQGNQAVRTSDLKGKAVENPQGQKLGTINNFVVDPNTGEIRYAIVGRGGFVGFGTKYTAVPWQALNYDSSKSALVLNMSKDRFSAAPSYSSSNRPNFSSASWQEQNDRYFGVSGTSGQESTPSRMRSMQGQGSSQQMQQQLGNQPSGNELQQPSSGERGSQMQQRDYETQQQPSSGSELQPQSSSSEQGGTAATQPSSSGQGSE